MCAEYGDKKAGDIIEREIMVLDESTDVAYAARVMKKTEVTSILVGRTGSSEPIGIVTERDILYRLVAENRSPFKTSIGKIMNSPLVTIDESASVKDAIKLMRLKSIRRMPVTKEGKIIGMMTLKSLIGNSHEKGIELAEVELPGKGVVCPYCQSKFDNKEDLSKHIDRLHLGTGLLEGDLRQW